MTDPLEAAPPPAAAALLHNQMTIRGSPPALWHSLSLAEGLVWLQNDGEDRTQR
eukprot:CAMPEP_0172555802 /NCGR_PEP_ID=MMETSP1067-20121228/60339_1 /TAXON_ID=265564 ORGANISM="Thalassiosira punctigera, Strain Tpunct2005C2" /NCGR_SAMPLE_ID=MMETSP1067 /ASSEMBLY_ACC=CAM_ASM_000444 /LENGTH=53 /DNA_ID=CAMNT_0013344401 /DNA_START=36 /DNA_END=195 /DNA_ORIENTATION=+